MVCVGMRVRQAFSPCSAQTRGIGSRRTGIRISSVRNIKCRSTAHSIFETAIAALQQAHPGVAAGFGFNTCVFIAGIRVLLAGLTPAGVANSWFLGGAVFSAFGWSGYLLVCVYFILGSAVTKFKLKEKEAAGIAEKRSGKRGPASVWGSGAAGVVCALLALLTGEYALFQTGFVASFGSKLSDTVSSEVGKGFGKTTYLITTLRRVPPGTEGAVSVEGTAAGIAAALTYALLATSVGQVSVSDALICTAAATIANVLESFIGATTQDNVQWLTNDVVNAIQITIAAALAILMKQLIL